MWGKLYKKGMHLPSREDTTLCSQLWAGTRGQEAEHASGPCTVRGGFTGEGWSHAQLKPKSMKSRKTCLWKKKKTFKGDKKETENYVIGEVSQDVARDGHCRRLGTEHVWLQRQKVFNTLCLQNTSKIWKKKGWEPLLQPDNAIRTTCVGRVFPHWLKSSQVNGVGSLLLGV